ncbi:hypothetical protein A3H38_02725 [candidate division WOR-1 bacterium RIFCSPLOWO2_02_FULL_46_20]|uniref:Translocation and assembly module TamB C-terminal domain-containing protein n=2 Tax=Saganbacteria TaxID=1703751 RepID=A0A1F4RAZ0_UNCSA|nr:MAG: hypothetical protein A3J44_00995 [candidate division WOR-1 bacterium RIFCSPHIGHO2_02_FULL_45_12]OGC05335.1 MAG: hypothetical protein A3H38_02725 [candidate division WOR-1 bacterium RIFCSPLOWO2_02_FULL_46_20]OGC08377.1 MAG: hypothetical protein A3F86_01950 [candidate division WOR-1 bacterium RIFCSPLOWO2_12_FULL_45_9]
MKKIALLFGLITLSLFSSAFSPADWRDSVYGKIKSETVKGLEQAFKTKVKIGKTEGIIVGQIVFHDVVVPNFAHAKKIYVNFNPVEFAYKKDVVPAISRITIEEAEFAIIRDKDNKINVLNFLPKADPGAPPPPPFLAKIIFKNCAAHYEDQLGFNKKKQTFSQKVAGINGGLGFEKNGKISIRLLGNIQEKYVPTSISVSGYSNYKTGKYSIDINTNKVDLKKWGDYVLNNPTFTITGGQADLSMTLTNPQLKGWPLSVFGELSIYNGSARFGKYKIDKTFGSATIIEEGFALKNLSTEINGLPVKIDGRLVDFTKQNLDFRISLAETPLNIFTAFLPETRSLDLKGFASAVFSLKGDFSSPKISGQIDLKEAKFYGQALSGQCLIAFKDKLLEINNISLNLYKGEINGDGKIDFTAHLPLLTLTAQLAHLNLANLSQNAPGIEGQAAGELTLSGPISQLKGILQTKLTRAMLFGQPVDTLHSSFSVKDGDLELENLSATSKTASIIASGKITGDLNFDVKAGAQGIALSGKGLLGKMQATINLFEGNMSWKLDDQFLAAPLKHLTASGEVSLAEGKIGEQEFDLAQGRLKVKDGLIQVENLLFIKNKSILQASGQTGIGCPTKLEIKGERINLEDLKILNHLLPEDAKDPIGPSDIDIKITGQLLNITSVDSLFDLDASGTIKLHNVHIAEVPISKSQIDFFWKDGRINSLQGSLITPKSNLSLDLTYEKDDKINGSIQGTIDAYDFRKLTHKYGLLQGKFGLTLILEGTTDQPVATTSFWLQGFRFNRINFDSVQGSLKYDQNKLTLIEPLRVSRNQDNFAALGDLDLASLQKNQPLESELNLTLKIMGADISYLITMGEEIQSEIARRFSTKTAGEKTKISFASLVMPTIQNFVRQHSFLLYSDKPEEKNFLNDWQDLFAVTKQAETARQKNIFGGNLFGNISLQGKIKNISGKFAGEVKNGYFRNFTFDSLRAKASLANEKVTINMLELTKDNGKLLTRGHYGFDNTLDLTVSAKNMPFSSMKVLFDQEFKGTINLDAVVDGSIKNPNFSGTLSGNKVTMAGVYFDQLALAMSKKNNLIFIENLSVVEGDNTSNISGDITLPPQGKINLKVALKDNAIGMLNLFTDQIKWIEGKASVDATLSGNFAEPKIDGKVFLNKSALYVKAIDAAIQEISGEAKIKNGLLEIKSLTGFWLGKTSKHYYNPLSIAGTIDLKHILENQPSVSLDLNFAPTVLNIDLPNLYNGKVEIEAARLTGPLYFNFSRAPLLTGKINIDDAIISLSQKKGGNEKKLPLRLDLSINLNKNVYAIMGDVNTLDLSNIFMNLEMIGQELKITGDLLAPSLKGKIFLKRGTVNIFNREFTLLSNEQQKSFFPYDAEKRKDNLARFTGESGKEGVMPDVTIVAKVEVENTEEDASGETVDKKVIILSYLQGVIGAAEKERGLKTSFYSFSEDTTKTPSEMVPAGHSEQDIKVMLLPDFIRSLTGVSQDETIDTNVVVADYLSSRLQTLLFRGIERELEHRLGLESLTLEYNVGKTVRQAMGVTETSGLIIAKPDWRVGFAKGFFDKFFIDVNYLQFASGFENENKLNYKLTYKLNPIWSIIYYREPPNLEDNIGYQKMTLQVGFSFW